MCPACKYNPWTLKKNETKCVVSDKFFLVDGFCQRLFSALPNLFPLFLYQPLPPQEEKELKETLQDIIGHGKKVKLEQRYGVYCP